MVDAMEAPYTAAFNASLYVEGNTLYVIGPETLGNIQLRYDVTGGRPVFQGRQYFDGKPSGYRHQGFSFAVLQASPYDSTSRNMLQILDNAAGTTRSLPLDYVPLDPGYGATVSGTAGWAAVMFYYSSGASGSNYETVLFDTTSDTAEPFAILPNGGFNYSIIAFPNLLYVGGDVYTVNGHEVNLTAQLPLRNVLDWDPATNRVLAVPYAYVQQDGYRVVDLADPAHPKISAPTVHARQYPIAAALGQDFFVLTGSPQNLAIYPISYTNGPRVIDTFPASPHMNALAARNGYLYWAGDGFGFPGRSMSRDLFEIVDITATPSKVVATLDRPLDETGLAVQLIGSYAYVGTDAEMIVYDVRTPSAPVQVAVVPAPAISFALNNNFLYAGSASGKTATLLVYDVSDPAHPRQVNSIPLADFAYGLASQPGWLTVALGKSGFSIYAIANLAVPVLSYHWSQTAWGVAGSGSLLYIAADFAGLEIFDLTKLSQPNLLSQTPLTSGEESGVYFPYALSISLDPRGIAWLCTPKDGRVYGIDVRQPAQPRSVAEFATGIGVGSSTGTAVGDGKLIVGGNMAFDVTFPQNIGLYQVEQTAPYLISPDRYGDVPPLARARSALSGPAKARPLGRLGSN